MHGYVFKCVVLAPFLYLVLFLKLQERKKINVTYFEKMNLFFRQQKQRKYNLARPFPLVCHGSAIMRITITWVSGVLAMIRIVS